MRILVMGAGVVGVTAAHALASDGHEVTVVERLAEAATETSFANAGLLAPGHSFAWASPKAPATLLRSLFRAGEALRLKPRLDLQLVRWGLRFLAECTETRARVNTLRKLRLCVYSLECLREVVAETGIEFDHVTRGNLYLYRDRDAFAAGVEHMRLLQDNGLTLEVCEPARVAELEPALAGQTGRIAGAIHVPGDETGDCQVFTRGLAAYCRERLGVRFLFDTEISRIRVAEGRIGGVLTGSGELDADVYVMALGCASHRFGRALGLDLPIYPVKGYSTTVRVDNRNQAPMLGGVDEQNLVAWARMGERLRLTSVAEFAGHDKSFRASDFDSMFRAARELFPGASDYADPEQWAGLRPMTPTTVPIFGLTGHGNLMLDVGHGHIGWTMACGSARLVADLLAGRRPAIDTDGLIYRR